MKSTIKTPNYIKNDLQQLSPKHKLSFQLNEYQRYKKVLYKERKYNEMNKKTYR